MDLKAIMNGNGGRPVQEKRVSPSHNGNTGNAPHVSPVPMSNGAYHGGGSSHQRPPSGQQAGTPLYGPPSASVGPPSQSQSRGLTPLQTPSQSSSAGQYPFPQQQPPLQSPASAHPGQPSYRPFETYSATTPGARPSSHGYSFAQPSPSMGQYGQAHHTSTSPTPSSHHSQTPHSVRQSPLAAMSHLPHQMAQPTPHPYHHSQPNTPLGPPQIPQRHSNHSQSNSQLDISSPHHSRTLSGASSGMHAGSPQHNPSIGNLVESPSAVYNRNSPHARRPSDFRSSLDRERSESVSPKTKIPPRPPSLGSRHSSQQEVYSARNSQQAGTSVAPLAEAAGHVLPHTPTHMQPQDSYAAHEVAQAHVQTSGPPVNENGNSLSNPLINQPSNSQHQSEKMGMSRLLAPVHAQALSLPAQAPSLTEDRVLYQKNPAPVSAQSAYNTPHHAQHTPHNTAAPSTTTHDSEPSYIQQEAEMVPIGSSQRNKRPADGIDGYAPPAKRQNILQTKSENSTAGVTGVGISSLSRRYKERPVWANLSHKNPRSRSTNVPNSSLPEAQVQSRPPPTEQTPSNGTPSDVNPLNQDPGRWEKSLMGGSPTPSFTMAVIDWLWAGLIANKDAEGGIEIEAKIGTIKDAQTGRRLEVPYPHACVLDPRRKWNISFESAMNEQEHRNVNHFLNKAAEDSHQRKKEGRVPIKYKHIRETDSFRTLNDLGMRSLPEVAHRRRENASRGFKLRTTTADKDGSVTARIVKVKIADDLHISGANDPYDIRISMNLEIQLGHLDFDAIADASASAPNRKKDRMSYQHLAYQADLTRVDTGGMPPKYELEVEVDANVLRRQMDLASTGAPSTFEMVVQGFIDNMTLLSRIPRV